MRGLFQSSAAALYDLGMRCRRHSTDSRRRNWLWEESERERQRIDLNPADINKRALCSLTGWKLMWSLSGTKSHQRTNHTDYHLFFFSGEFKILMSQLSTGTERKRGMHRGWGWSERDFPFLCVVFTEACYVTATPEHSVTPDWHTDTGRTATDSPTSRWRVNFKGYHFIERFGRKKKN